MRDRSCRWALPPVSTTDGARERQRRRRAERGMTDEIRWRWNEVCSGGGLANRIVPGGHGSWEVPRIGPITLGPPTRFSVELRPGQLPEDFLPLRPRIAAAYDVDDVDIRHLAQGWITIELLEGVPALAALPELPVAEARPALRAGRRPAALPARHGTPRRRRGPFRAPHVVR